MFSNGITINGFLYFALLELFTFESSVTPQLENIVVIKKNNIIFFDLIKFIFFSLSYFTFSVIIVANVPLLQRVWD
jgi:hypothetical protein